MSGFWGLEIGKSGLFAQQTALQVTGHNVANANTPGYSRQVGAMVTNRPWYSPNLTGSTQVGQMGTGAKIESINRIRDQFVDDQIRQENCTGGYWEGMQTGLSKIEVILNEPSNDGLRSVMDQFWESWQDLSANPESEAVRSVVAQRGMAVADTFNHMYRQMKELREDVNDNIRIDVEQINSMALQIRDLNQQILAINVAGQEPNDLLDKRDMLLDDLSKIADVNMQYDKNDMVAIQIGGRTLVQGVEMTKLSTKTDTDGMHMVIWEDTGVKAQIKGGELRGYLDLRGKTQYEGSPSKYRENIPNIINDLNALAKTIVERCNEIHQQGYSLNNKSSQPDGINFFQMPIKPYDKFENWAEFIEVEDFIINDPKNITAASNPTWDAEGHKVNFGDGGNALEIAELKHNRNSGDARVETEAIEIKANHEISFSIVYSGKYYNISYKVQAADALKDIQDNINTNIQSSELKDKLSLSITEDSSGNEKLAFSSNDNKFTGIDNLTVKDGTNSIDYGNYQVLKIKDVTTDDFWRSTAADLGVDSQEATRMVNNQDALLNQLENKRQSLSGVSLDEEMSNIIKFQHAYNAASRFITTIDEQLDVIVNRMGLVGR